MAPAGHHLVQVLDWRNALATNDLATLVTAPCAVLVEAFGCNPPPEFTTAVAKVAGSNGQQPVWINLEYLSAEPYAERNHALPSPIREGPADGWTKWFFYPGFSTQTGGLLREHDLQARHSRFDRLRWLASRQIKFAGETMVSMFCYEPPALEGLLQAWTKDGLNGQPVHLLVAAGRATDAVRLLKQTTTADSSKNPTKTDENRLLPNINARNMLSISYLPLLTQSDFDEMLWACDLNFVRGEDSVIRAIWAGKPFVWQIYPQDDGAHQPKLNAFLSMLDAPPSLREFHQRWNAGKAPTTAPFETPITASPTADPHAIDLPAWQAVTERANARLQAQPDLASSLLGFVEKSR